MNSLDLKDALRSLRFLVKEGNGINPTAGAILLLSCAGFQCNKGREV